MQAKIDPELLEDFLSESDQLLNQCRTALSEFAESGDAKRLESFGLTIDRIMGTAATLELKALSVLARQGKEISYKASQVTDLERLLAVSSILSQLLKGVMQELAHLRKHRVGQAEAPPELLNKLKKANEGLGDLRASVKL